MKAQASFVSQELEQAACVAKEMSARSCGYSADPDSLAAFCSNYKASFMLDSGLHTTT